MCSIETERNDDSNAIKDINDSIQKLDCCFEVFHLSEMVSRF